MVMDLRKIVQLGILIIFALVILGVLSFVARVAIGLLQVAFVVAAIVGLYLLAEQLIGKKR
jgi:Na+/pantothenate symporter